MENSAEYEKAVQTSRDAAIAYASACVQYRKMEIDDAGFALAIKINQQAGIDFDAAFEEEQLRGV